MSSIHHDEVALVTGGASGLGKATAERLSKLGMNVFAIDLPKAVESFEKEKADSIIRFRSADVTNEEQISKVLEEIRQAHNRLDYIINCAGIFLLQRMYDVKNDKPHDLAAASKVMEVNFLGTVNVIRLAIPLMLKNEPSQPDGQRGVIINVSSVTMSNGPPGTTVYAASKAALAAITMPLAKELGPSGIRVVDIAPGAIETPMLSIIPSSFDGHGPFPKRRGHVEEFAHLVQTVIENPYINATTIRLDAGFRN